MEQTHSQVDLESWRRTPTDKKLIVETRESPQLRKTYYNVFLRTMRNMHLSAMKDVEREHQEISPESCKKDAIWQ